MPKTATTRVTNDRGKPSVVQEITVALSIIMVPTCLTIMTPIIVAVLTCTKV
ncbi:ac78 [Hemileuca sp. nucleopolyhedrovirus]|uniref:Ac78 n=1 Tax=Hemileuca sp. nucleopolyhedrovirus TaxID=1367203 RepID=S5MQ74_9ABAC|nr:ac78 [Hemileuca sp. nucleopolyhedrovirus]AGR56823.1 ac78 [Hemileuca sp. nucleopolyhedrovirus]